MAGSGGAGLPSAPAPGLQGGHSSGQPGDPSDVADGVPAHRDISLPDKTKLDFAVGGRMEMHHFSCFSLRVFSPEIHKGIHTIPRPAPALKSGEGLDEGGHRPEGPAGGRGSTPRCTTWCPRFTLLCGEGVGASSARGENFVSLPDDDGCLVHFWRPSFHCTREPGPVVPQPSTSTVKLEKYKARIPVLLSPDAGLQCGRLRSVSRDVCECALLSLSSEPSGASGKPPRRHWRLPQERGSGSAQTLCRPAGCWQEEQDLRCPGRARFKPQLPGSVPARLGQASCVPPHPS